MKGKKWLILAIALLASSVGVTQSSFVDYESSTGNAFQAWASTQWVQTTKAEFEAGVLNQVDTSSSPGDVKLGTTYSLLEPTTSIDSEGSWYFTSWSRRAPVTIDNSGSALTDYQIKVNVTYDTDMQPDFDDIRFVDFDDSTELSHWRESYTASTSAIFWVKVPSVPSGDKTIYMYYGNAAASSASDGNATFVFFDDFEEHNSGADPDGWTDQGTENFYVALHDSEKWFQVNTWNDWRNGSTASSMANIGDAVWSARVYYHQEGTNCWGGIGVHIGNGDIGRIVVIRDGGWYRANEPDWSSASEWQSNADIHFPIGTKGRIELVTNGTNLDAYWYNPSGYSPAKVTVFTGFAIPSGTGKLDVHIERPGSVPINNRWIDADDIIVRKYASSEPTTSVGSEDGWSRRAPVTINNSGSALTDYQIKVNVTYDTDMQPDFDDIRFMDSDGSTPLSHWRESYTASTSAIFWVKVPSIPSGNKTIYMYYGNAAASSASDGNATFIFFDDFSGDLSKWNIHIDTDVAITSSYGNPAPSLEISGGITSSPYGFAAIGSDATYAGFQDGIIEADIYPATEALPEIIFRGNYSANTGYKGRWDCRSGSESPWMKPPYSGWAAFDTAVARFGIANQWQKAKLVVIGSTFMIYSNGSLKSTVISTQYSGAGEIGLANHYGTYARFDNVRVRKCASQPIYVSLGTIASQVLNTGVAGARWDALFWDETLESGTDISFKVRASNTQFLKGAATPSWVPVGETSPVTSGLPSGQYMQWQATLTTSDTSKTPTLREVRVYHY